MLRRNAGKKLHDNEFEIRRQSLELLREKKRYTDLESELLSVQGIADNRSSSINVHQYERKIQEVTTNSWII